MRIAIFSDNFDPEMSGITDSITTLGIELARRGHFVQYYAPRYSPHDYNIVGRQIKEINFGERISIIRLPSIPYPTPTQQGRLAIPSGLASLKLRKFNPDVIHSQLFFGTGLEGLLDAKILRKPFIGTNHTAIKEFMRYGPIHSEWAITKMLHYVNWYYRQGVITTAPSHSVTDEMKAYGFTGDCRVISNPIDTEIFKPLTGTNTIKEKFSVSERAVIHAGRQAPERSIGVILKAMPLIIKKFPDAELLLAGKGVAQNNLRKQAASLGIADKVKFLGFLDKPTLAEAYNASKIFAITSTADTQSMVMMQAMASGLPVIGVRARALPEYIGEDRGIVIEPHDERALANSIIKLFGNEEKRKALGEGGRKFAMNFSVAPIVDEWEKIYETAVKTYSLKK